MKAFWLVEEVVGDVEVHDDAETRWFKYLGGEPMSDQFGGERILLTPKILCKRGLLSGCHSVPRGTHVDHSTIRASDKGTELCARALYRLDGFFHLHR